MNLRVLFHRPTAEHFAVPSKQIFRRNSDGFEVLQSGLFRFFSLLAQRKTISL
jgi:hypothetical protein